MHHHTFHLFCVIWYGGVSCLLLPVTPFTSAAAGFEIENWRFDLRLEIRLGKPVWSSGRRGGTGGAGHAYNLYGVGFLLLLDGCVGGFFFFACLRVFCFGLVWLVEIEGAAFGVFDLECFVVRTMKWGAEI
ncbi:hypothetical protein EJ03DRAFT_97196 [Teratosphaeria nubilosa]|uniref:Uncharacterized protein n=1 Tax=Teratosphaeria nubilosa TaxID=161662 RepID=A0A6G1L9A9_9PEZI|nr:hypothetical protein EJ03DRAFT_97196 [Teratosphaeria nubilosa]